MIMDQNELDELLGTAETWSLYETLNKLCEATQHLKDVHQCDADGHEQFYHALAAGRKYLEKLENHFHYQEFLNEELAREREEDARYRRMLRGED